MASLTRCAAPSWSWLPRIPIEYEGTFPLPEAQLDRFLLKLSVGYPSPADEEQILLNLQRKHPITTIGPVVEGARLLDLQPLVWEVHVDDTVRQYIVRLIHATRQHSTWPSAPAHAAAWPCSKPPRRWPSSVGAIMSCLTTSRRWWCRPSSIA
jgi:MoxR-like ATPase